MRVEKDRGRREEEEDGATDEMIPFASHENARPEFPLARHGRAQKHLRPFVEGPVLPSPLHRRLSLKLRPHNRPRLRRKRTWRRRNYRRRGKSAGRRGEEEGRPLARSLAPLFLPSPSALWRHPSIHPSLRLSVVFPAYLRRLCLFVRSLARPSLRSAETMCQ